MRETMLCAIDCDLEERQTLRAEAERAGLPLTFAGWGDWAAVPRGACVSVRHAAYVDETVLRALRARGVREGAVLFRHALKNAAPPVAACVGPMAAYALTGSMVVETVFTIGGLGSRFVESIGNRDYPVIMAATILLAALIALFSLLSDLACRALDPRVELS